MSNWYWYCPNCSKKNYEEHIKSTPSCKECSRTYNQHDLTVVKSTGQSVVGNELVIEGQERGISSHVDLEDIIREDDMKR